MKKFTLFVFIWAMFLCSVKADSYLTTDDMPNGANYLPAPPDTSNQRFFNDWSQYCWGKSLRKTERGEMAVRDAVLSVYTLANEFSGAFGMKISKTNTPELFMLIQLAMYDADHSTTKAKALYMRKRPYVQFKESSLVPTDEARLASNGSYPSGHTSVGWAIALILAEINVDRQDTILHRGYEFGQSRVIAGFHYQSDVDAGRMTGSAAVARLHANADFMTQLEKAKAEYKSKVNSINAVTNETRLDTDYYDLNGIRVEEPQKGIYIHDGKKILR